MVNLITDPSGDFSGQQFSANDILLQIGHAKRLTNNLQMGLNLKFVGLFMSSTML